MTNDGGTLTLSVLDAGSYRQHTDGVEQAFEGRMNPRHSNCDRKEHAGSGLSRAKNRSKVKNANFGNLRDPAVLQSMNGSTISLYGDVAIAGHHKYDAVGYELLILLV